MEHNRILPNRVKALRLSRGWSQEELAERAGVSRAGVSAIEARRLVPSVATGLALAAALGSTVEELFDEAGAKHLPAAWAWPPSQDPCRFWHARVSNRLWHYPVEATPLGTIEHDGVSCEGHSRVSSGIAPDRSLVMATCDPAAGLLAAALAKSSGYRLLVFTRSSQQALEMLRQGLVHIAGVHLANPRQPHENIEAVGRIVGRTCRVVRMARWQEGVVLTPGLGIRSLRAALKADLRWVGRELGSAARRCLDDILEERRPPRRIVGSHMAVASAVRSGWADAGVCLRLCGDEAGLPFFSVREEAYDLCFDVEAAADPRIVALLDVIQSTSFRRLLGELPGYDATEAGSEQA